MVCLFASEPETPLRGLTLSVVAGEACPSSLVRDHYAAFPDLPLSNEYGPTETVVGCCVYETLPAGEDGPVPIGRGVGNTRVYIGCGCRYTSDAERPHGQKCGCDWFDGGSESFDATWSDSRFRL